MNPTATHSSDQVEQTARAPWIVAGRLLDALARRDFAAVHACLDPDVRLWALGPAGPVRADGARNVVNAFRSWFDDAAQFDVVDASIGQVGARLYLRWCLRPRESSDPEDAQLIEQHVFATAREQIEELDLLSSGRQVEAGSFRKGLR